MNKPLVLVVEDDRPIRNLIVTTLKAHDYHYLTAENGHSAIIERPPITLISFCWIWDCRISTAHR